MRAIILAALANVGMAAAGSEYLIQGWEINQGLPQGSVLAIAQTRDRYLWVGTFGGLARFDGLTFTNFDSGTTPGLPSNRIVGLCEDRLGSLWVGTGEAGVAEYRNGVFRTYSESDGLPSNKVRALVADRAGDVWIATWKGLVRRRAGRFELFPSAADVLSLAEGRDGAILAGTSTGVSQFREGRFGPYFEASRPVLALHQDRNGTLWLGTSDGLFWLEDGRLRQSPVTGEVRQILQDRTGALWVGTSAGLWRGVQGDWQKYGTADGLSENFIRSLAEDSEGNIWAGANARGLNRLKRGPVSVIGSGAGLAAENAVPVLEDRDGAIWYGLTCGGLVRYSQGSYRVYTEKDGLAGNCVWSLAQDRDGILWVGTRNGLSRFHEGKFRNYNQQNSGLSDDWVTVIYPDREGRLWIGTGNGANRLEDGVFKSYHQSDGLANDDVRFITEDPAGALWFGTTGGLSRLEHDRFTSYTKSNGLPHNFVRAIHFDRSGTMWIGTYGGGLARFKDGHFSSFNTTNGLTENAVSRILEDSRGDLWLSGNHGIHRVNIRELEDYAGGRARFYPVISYGTPDGMISAECNGGGSPAGWKGRDGRLYFPTQRGVAVIDPETLTANRQAPAVWIEQALVDRNPGGASGEVRVPPGAADVEIHYTALSLSSPEKVRFQYRLEGLESDWVDAGARRAAYYTHLPPGHFRFVVAAANGDGVWNREGAGLDLNVVPAFWQTWSFRLTLMLVLASAAAFAYRRRIQSMERAASQQAAYSRQLIASQENERQRIASELHDSLGQTLAIIKNRAMLSLNEPDNPARAFEQLDEIVDAATHALHEVREIAYDQRPFQLDRLGLRSSIETMVAKAAESGNTRFRADIEDLDGLLLPDERIHAYRIVQEAVNNVLKHSDAADATVIIKRAGDGFEVTIEDNGKGFRFEEGGGSGFGLNGMAERARILGGRLTIDSMPGRGTIVHVVVTRGKRAGES